MWDCPVQLQLQPNLAALTSAHGKVRSEDDSFHAAVDLSLQLLACYQHQAIPGHAAAIICRMLPLLLNMPRAAGVTAHPAEPARHWQAGS